MRWTWWAIAAGAALLAASQWLHAPSVEYLVPLVVATVLAAAATWLVRGPQRRWAIACATLLAAATGLAVQAQRNLWLVSHRWEDWQRNAAVRGLVELNRAIDDAVVRCAIAASQALDASHDRARAFGELAPLVAKHDELGVVRYDGDSAFAWAGIVRAPIDQTREGLTVVATPFYLAVQIVQQRGDARAAAIALLDAVPPADRLSAPLARRIADEMGLSGFNFAPPIDSSTGPEILHFAIRGQRLFDVRADPSVQGTVAQRIAEAVRARAGIVFSLALAFFIIGVWRGTRSLSERLGALAVALACTALVPLNQYSNLTRLFDPGVYFTPRGGPLTGNAGALATTGAIALLGVLAVFRRRATRIPKWATVLTVLVVAGLGPFLLRELSRGVQIPAHGVDARLWLIWQVPLFLAAVSVLLAGAAAGAAVLGPRRGLAPWVAPLAAAIPALLAPVVWDAPGRWPWWYTILWIVALGMLALSRRTRFVILSASTVAALGATTLVWGRTARGRVDAAKRDVAGLSETDSVAVTLLRRFGLSLAADYAPTSRQALLQTYASSDIAAAGNPIALFAWPTDSGPTAHFETAQIPVPMNVVAQLVQRARATGAITLSTVRTDVALELVLAAPAATGGVTAAVVAPKSRLFEVDPFAQLVGLELDTDAEPPYTVRLRESIPGDFVNPSVSWRREGSELHGDWVVRTGTGVAPAHVEVELRPLYALVQRGALIVLLDLAIVGLLWLASVVADGGAGRWIRVRWRTWGRSYRVRLSLALFAFFVIPAIAFAIWSYGQLATDATQSRALLVSETLRALAPPPNAPMWLPAESDRLDTPLFLYRNGELSEASDPLYADIAPIGRYLGRDVELTLADEETTSRLERVADGSALFGYRSFSGAGSPSTVIAAPARADELPLGRRRRDLGVLVLFATAVGALAALWLSGIAARQLARPIRTLREAALALASGARTPPLEGEPTVEFQPVFTAFRRMASDLNASRTALEEAQRRTAAVLRNVASGVVAVDVDGRVSIANPRSQALLSNALAAGERFSNAAPEPVARVVDRFLASTDDEEDFELTLGQQQLRGRLTRLARGGAVVTLDDVTELARAQRVLAWGEMARQVAHEIKNPLTPIRLGVQHLRRARADSRVDFDRVLEHNVNQILTEIDRLDEIARAFSRYGAAPNERAMAAPVDVARVVREVVSLERMGQEQHLEWREVGVDAPVYAFARTDELKEVLLNVLENARHADATTVTVSVKLDDRDGDAARASITVADDGHGIPPDVLSRVFEPHFSTRTSGSGLGLAISRQLVEGWGGTISIESSGRGTVVVIQLPVPSPSPS
ncbi:MAG TPA: ATP-binding protein [Gemmatimonadaceae bacterium]|nr:ATP-binding protein [Gemmatimonadaceae bacterium]